MAIQVGRSGFFYYLLHLLKLHLILSIFVIVFIDAEIDLIGVKNRILGSSRIVLLLASSLFELISCISLSLRIHSIYQVLLLLLVTLVLFSTELF